MRGRNFENAVVILDEAQNVTVIVNGDITQCDLPASVRSGLADALARFEEDEMIGVVRFGKEDCVRSALCQRTLHAYGTKDGAALGGSAAGVAMHRAQHLRLIIAPIGRDDGDSRRCVDILVERLPAGAATLRYLQQLEDALTGARAITKRLTLPQPCYALEPAPYTYTRRTRTQVTDGEIVLTLSAASRLIIAGLFSAAVYCANFARALGFETIVCEHREEVLSNMAAELAPDVKLVQQFPAVYLEREGCHAATAILSLTHDARIDDLTMMEAVNLPAFYLGAMGLQRNSAKRKARLTAIAELTSAQLQRIHAPVGLDIGSKTSAEIAQAIMADIVRHKNGLVETDALSPVRAVSE